MTLSLTGSNAAIKSHFANLSNRYSETMLSLCMQVWSAVLGREIVTPQSPTADNAQDMGSLGLQSKPASPPKTLVKKKGGSKQTWETPAPIQTAQPVNPTGSEGGNGCFGCVGFVLLIWGGFSLYNITTITSLQGDYAITCSGFRSKNTTLRQQQSIPDNSSIDISFTLSGTPDYENAILDNRQTLQNLQFSNVNISFLSSGAKAPIKVEAIRPPSGYGSDISPRYWSLEPFVLQTDYGDVKIDLRLGKENDSICSVAFPKGPAEILEGSVSW